MKSRQLIASLGLGALGVFLVSLLTAPQEPLSAADPVKVEDVDDNVQVRPVEDDMHEFMEYVFQPGYKRLKAAIASEPAENAAWKTIKAEGLTLGESANLLLFRGPSKDRPEWNQMAADVRVAGGDLYQAAKKKDYGTARKAYETMLTKCNACHTKFDDGEHQLMP